MKSLCGLLLLLACNLNAQDSVGLKLSDAISTVTQRPSLHFSKYKAIKYQEVPWQDEDSENQWLFDFKNISSLADIKVKIVSNDDDSTSISLMRKGILIKTLKITSSRWFVPAFAYVADINADGKKDIKIIFNGGGNGIAGELFYKIFLFNTGNSFDLISFFDFHEEPERDLDGDGVYEILGCDHIFHSDGHSYWIYNSYNYKKGQLVSSSAKFGYPLWTKHLFTTNKVVAKKISYKERMKRWRKLPDGYLAK